MQVDPDTYFFAGNYQYFMAYMSRKWGNRFVDEPLYAGLALHHNPPSYNSGHVYILNRKSLDLLATALRNSRTVLSPEFAANAGSIQLHCEWPKPVPNKFLPGCSQGCHTSATLHQAQAYCELVPDCKGVVDNGESAGTNRYVRLRNHFETNVLLCGRTHCRLWASCVPYKR